MDVIGSVTGRLYQTKSLLARAGEGAVYRVAGDTSILIKIFDELPSARTIQKLDLLTRYAPKPAYTALPLETVLDQASREVIGFVQPFFDRTIPVKGVMDRGGRRLLGLPDSLDFKVKVCRLLAEAVDRLHAANLVMGDVSDTNFLLGRNWLGRPTVVRVIDCNSLQVSVRTNQGHEIFVSGVATEAYLAPEIQPTDWSISTRTIFSDSFGLAVACWLILFNGSHPFAVASPRNVDIPPLGERIERRLFHYAPASPLPAGWSQLTLDPSIGVLPNDLREMFFRTFSTADSRDRPTADDWIVAFRSWEAKPKPRAPLAKLGSWKSPLANRLARLLDGLKSWTGRGLVLGGFLLRALFYYRSDSTSKPSPNPKPTPQAPVLNRPSPGTAPTKRARIVDRAIFPETIWNPHP